MESESEDRNSWRNHFSRPSRPGCIDTRAGDAQCNLDLGDLSQGLPEMDPSQKQ